MTTTAEPTTDEDRPTRPPRIDGNTGAVLAIWLLLFLAGLLIYAAH